METEKMLTTSANEIVSPLKLSWQRFLKNKIAVVGAVIFILITILVIVVPIVSPYKLHDFNLEDKNQAPSAEHWLGTDAQGRDVLTRLFLGGRISILVGVIAAIITVILGSIIGGIAGYYGGWVDNLLMRFAEIINSLPFLPLVITISAILIGVDITSTQKMYLVMVLIGLLSWPSLARMVRGQILSLKEQEFMLATKALGISDAAKIARHLIPNTFAYIIVTATLSMASAILTEASLSFLGLGVQPPIPTWGNMMELAKKVTVIKSQPWLWLPPGIMTMLTVVSINLLGEGLRDAFDPKGIK